MPGKAWYPAARRGVRSGFVGVAALLIKLAARQGNAWPGKIEFIRDLTQRRKVAKTPGEITTATENHGLPAMGAQTLPVRLVQKNGRRAADIQRIHRGRHGNCHGI